MAILLREPEAAAFTETIVDAPRCALSAGSWIELTAVLTRGHGGRKVEAAERLIEKAGIVIEPVTVEQAETGRQAYRRYGIGAGHPARLNFGDCFAYALARVSGEPLLFKGADFAQTDIVAAIFTQGTP